MSSQIWETRPLDTWNKAKELRAKWQNSINNGQLLAQGNVGRVDWGSCFNNLNVVEDNPAGSMIQAKNQCFARQCRLASEVRGWGRELCGYVNTCWGSMFLNMQMDGTPFPLRDMVIPFSDPCDQHLKRGIQAMDFSPIPRWQNDSTIYVGPHDPDRELKMAEHRVQCTLRVINDIERIYGMKFDDEKFVEAFMNHETIMGYAFDIAKCMTHTPSPLSQKELYTFYTMGTLTKVDPEETVKLWRDLRDEVQWRMENNIAAVGNERYRYMEAHPSPWHFLKYYRYLEKYGAVCIGSQYSHMLAGPMSVDENGELIPRKLPKYNGTPKIKTREDVLRAIYVNPMFPHNMKVDEYMCREAITDFAKGFHVDGAIMPLWRCGVGCTLTRKEQGLRLSEIGVNVLHYEGSQPGDRNDLDERRFLNQIDVWMESQGLRKLDE